MEDFSLVMFNKVKIPENPKSKTNLAFIDKNIFTHLPIFAGFHATIPQIDCNADITTESTLMT